LDAIDSFFAHGSVNGFGSSTGKMRSMSFEQQQISKWLAMASVKAKRSLIKEVESKVAGKKCLICDRPANGNRGLCVSHCLKFYRTRNSLPRKKWAAFEQEQIEAGRILASGAIRELKDPNPFESEVGAE
jgi:hypothetical protein